MKTQNLPKKLTLVKRTVAHLNYEQMNAAQGGNTTGERPTARDCQNAISTDACITLIDCYQDPVQDK